MVYSRFSEQHTPPPPPRKAHLRAGGEGWRKWSGRTTHSEEVDIHGVWKPGGSACDDDEYYFTPKMYAFDAGRTFCHVLLLLYRVGRDAWYVVCEIMPVSVLGEYWTM